MSSEYSGTPLPMILHNHPNSDELLCHIYFSLSPAPYQGLWYVTEISWFRWLQYQYQFEAFPVNFHKRDFWEIQRSSLQLQIYFFSPKQPIWDFWARSKCICKECRGSSRGWLEDLREVEHKERCTWTQTWCCSFGWDIYPLGLRLHSLYLSSFNSHTSSSKA